jgi:CO dehydrogenase/acetyl-CoA synthase delta subunit
MTNTIDRYEFEAAIESVGYEDIRTDYSGRFMYGATCIAVVTGNPSSIKAALLARAHELEEEADEVSAESEEGEADPQVKEQRTLVQNLEWLAEATRSDDMGRDAVVYYPGWEFSS